MTTLGMKEQEMKEIAGAIVALLQHTKPALDEKGGQSRAKVEFDRKALSDVQKRVSTLLHAFPLYPELVID